MSAAERLAEEIRGRAHADADAIRARAGSESEAARSAIRERIQHLSELADGMLEQLAGMRSELDALSGSLAGDRAPEVQPAVAAVPETAAAPGTAAGPETAAAPETAAVPETAAAPELARATTPESRADRVDDAGARLIALNLALSDTPRDEAARQLRDQVPDPDRLVDEVYASVDR